MNQHEHQSHNQWLFTKALNQTKIFFFLFHNFKNTTALSRNLDLIMASFQEELKLARQRAQRRHKLHQNKSENEDEDKNKDKDDHKDNTVVVLSDDLLKSYSKKEEISDQIKCLHSMNGKQKCINCISRQSLTIFNRDELLLKNGLYHYIFCRNESIENLINISRSSNPNSLKSFGCNAPKSSLQYGEILFYAFAHILNKIQSLSTSFDYKHTIFIDFGSGIAKTLFVAALLYPFKQCVGIEIIHKIHLKALNYKQKIPNKYNHLFQCKPNDLHIINGNIFDEDLLNKTCFTEKQLNNSNYIIFIASTAFNTQMMEMLSNKLCKIFKNTLSHSKKHQIFIITLSHPLPNFSVKLRQLFRMSWGNCQAFFQSYTP